MSRMSARPWAWIVIGLIVALAIVVVACSGAPAASTAATPAVTAQVSVTNLAYEPATLSVPAGVPFAIQLTNNDTVPHNLAIVGGPEGSKSEILGAGQSTHVYPALAAGAYRFMCEVHPEMTGDLSAT